MPRLLRTFKLVCISDLAIWSEKYHRERSHIDIIKKHTGFINKKIIYDPYDTHEGSK